MNSINFDFIPDNIVEVKNLISTLKGQLAAVHLNVELNISQIKELKAKIKKYICLLNVELAFLLELEENKINQNGNCDDDSMGNAVINLINSGSSSANINLSVADNTDAIASVAENNVAEVPKPGVGNNNTAAINGVPNNTAVKSGVDSNNTAAINSGVDITNTVVTSKFSVTDNTAAHVGVPAYTPMSLFNPNPQSSNSWRVNIGSVTFKRNSATDINDFEDFLDYFDAEMDAANIVNDMRKIQILSTRIGVVYLNWMKQQGLQLYSLNWSEFKDKLKTRCCSKIYDVVKINEFKEIRKKAEESVADFCDRFENAMLRASQVDSYDTRIKLYECMPDYIANKIELKFSLHECSLLTLLNAAVGFESLSI